MADPTTIEEKIARFENKPDMVTAAALAGYYDSMGNYKESVNYFKKAAEFNNNKEKNFVYDIFESTYYGFRREIFSLDELKQSAKNALASDHIDEREKGRIYYYMSSLIIKDKNSEDLLNYIREAQQFFSNVKDANFKHQKEDIHILHTLYIDDNPQEAVRLKKASMSDGWDENAGDLNAFSWWCFEHGINLDEAEELARKGIELSEPGNEKAMIIDTAAEIVNLKGNHKEAVKLAEMAVKESPERKFYQEQLERFKKLAE